MATIMSKVKQVALELPHGTARPRNDFSIKSHLMATAVDKGERYGASFLFGYAKGKLGDKFVWRGVHGDAWIGGGALILALILNVFSKGRSGTAKHLERIGDAGVQAALQAYGAQKGLEHSGLKVAIVAPGGQRKIAGDVVGAIGPAKGGPYLDTNTIMRFAQAGAR